MWKGPTVPQKMTPTGYDIHRANHGFSMALIEIDGLPNLKMVDLSMANC